MPGNKKNNRKPRDSPGHSAVKNNNPTEVIENPYYGMDDMEGNEDSVTVKKFDNPYYNEAE